ncbi:MAG: TRAP transporter small permease [Chromatiales bacterium]|jgi:TRAP-type C4-dicarboxylate transport system permease small subunit|nr:TRAP transporter small permease [Chromatiales bacterium]
MLDRLLGVANKTSQVLVWAGGTMLLFAAVLTTLEVFLRKFANFSFGGADEISGYLFAISTVFAFSYATLQRAHVRIDALYMHLPRAVQLFLDVMGFLALGFFLFIACSQAFAVWKNSWDYSSVSITPMVTPLALPQGFWLVGLLFFVFCFVALFLRVAQALIQRDWVKVSQLISARSLEEEISEETEHAKSEIEREHALRERAQQR